MRPLLPIIALLTGFSISVQAAERPRAPLAIGSGLTTQMAPPFLSPDSLPRPNAMRPGGLPDPEPSPALTVTPPDATALAAGNVRFVNYGNAAIAMSFWDGVGAWTTFRIAPGSSYDLNCAQCGDDVHLALHDGTTNKTVDVRKGTIYAITPVANAWVLRNQTPQVSATPR